MKRWAMVTILLYAAVLVALIAPVAQLAFVGRDWNLARAWDHANEVWPLWIWLGLMVLCQAAMLALPLRMAQERPVTKIWIFWPILATVVMFLVLAAAMALVAWEAVGLAWRDLFDDFPLARWELLGCVVLFWALWAFLFGFYTGKARPRGRLARLVQFLIAGSITELVVAIPAHVYARAKNDCCGGYLTVWGLAAGIAVGLFAFGPGVFLLFARRVRSIRGRKKAAGPPSQEPDPDPSRT